MTQNDALTTAVDAEFAAIFTYGVTTAFVGSDQRDAVGEFNAAHRVRRDAVNAALVSAGGAEQVPAAGYTIPFEVTDDKTAAKALLQAETTCASAYRALVEQADGPDVRRLGVDGLTECATRIAFWRGVSGLSPATVAFPGDK
ncbi:ferritin-like domain-containing protein [Gordonia sp. HY442]|uniref:ferritin-like domain-containing protein n=1 Tax=Gordonia zhenghanii TaxID=2911516 RepID=UPI001F22BAD9|nr:ferritin-like domain-containing protein [Gordonia zhenghanii]MCF8602763.1 ferritin-like domain-containing protein [Gordonia zhenghanii]